MLHFIVRPGSVWLQRAMVVAAFYVPLAREVGIEARAKRAKPAGSGRTEGAACQAANDNRATVTEAG